MKRYGVEIPHARHVALLSLTLYDHLQPLAGVPSAEPWRDYLETAALLHDIGYFIAKKGHHRHSRWILENTYETQAWLEGTRQWVADLAYFHRKPLSVKKAQYLAQTPGLWALSFILRIADGLDRSHRQDVSIEQVAVSDKTIAIKVSHLSDDDYRHLMESKAQGFRQAFGRNLKIKRLEAGA